MRTATRPFSRRRSLMILGVALTTAALVLTSPGTAQARVHVDERPSAGWGVNGRVYATAIVGNTVFVGGVFSAAVAPNGSQVARRNLAAFNLTDGSLRTNWRVDAGSTVRALTSDGTWLYVGGAFGRLANQPHLRLGRVRVTDGQVDNGFNPSVNNTVRALALGGGGVFLGGTFTSVNNVAMNRVAKVSATTGQLNTQFRAPAAHNVYALAYDVARNILWVGGQFNRISNTAREGIAGVDGTTGAIRGPAFAGALRPTLGLALSDDGTRLYNAAGNYPNLVNGWSTSSGARLWRVATDGDNQAIAQYDNTVYAGFHDGYRGNRNTKLIAINGSTGAVDTAFMPAINMFWGVFAISVNQNGLVVGGEFTAVEGVVARYWARWLAR